METKEEENKDSLKDYNKEMEKNILILMNLFETNSSNINYKIGEKVYYVDFSHNPVYDGICIYEGKIEEIIVSGSEIKAVRFNYIHRYIPPVLISTDKNILSILSEYLNSFCYDSEFALLRFSEKIEQTFKKKDYNENSFKIEIKLS